MTACLEQKCEWQAVFVWKEVIDLCTTLRINMLETGRNISRLRKSKGITIRQIQETMGFNTPQAIYKWQNGTTLPSLENLVVLAELFGTTINEIVIVQRWDLFLRIRSHEKYVERTRNGERQSCGLSVNGFDPHLSAQWLCSSEGKSAGLKNRRSGCRESLEPP